MKRAFSSHAAFRPKQEAASAYTFFSEPGSTAAERGARALADFLAPLTHPKEPASEERTSKAGLLATAP